MTDPAVGRIISHCHITRQTVWLFARWGVGIGDKVSINYALLPVPPVGWGDPLQMLVALPSQQICLSNLVATTSYFAQP